MIRQPPPPREAAAAPAAPPDDPASAEASGIMAQHGMPAPSTIPTPPEGPRQQPGAAAAAVQPAHGCQLACLEARTARAVSGSAAKAALPRLRWPLLLQAARIRPGVPKQQALKAERLQPRGPAGWPA